MCIPLGQRPPNAWTEKVNNNFQSTKEFMGFSLNSSGFSFYIIFIL